MDENNNLEVNFHPSYETTFLNSDFKDLSPRSDSVKRTSKFNDLKVFEVGVFNPDFGLKSRPSSC